jgi:hypothetical protein
MFKDFNPFCAWNGVKNIAKLDTILMRLDTTIGMA